jgi:lactate dehydrogenase-like 2-hydroxyacid dehydrogenase
MCQCTRRAQARVLSDAALSMEHNATIAAKHSSTKHAMNKIEAACADQHVCLRQVSSQHAAPLQHVATAPAGTYHWDWQAWGSERGMYVTSVRGPACCQMQRSASEATAPAGTQRNHAMT